MSWLAKETGLSANVFEFLALARDSQTRKQAELVMQEHLSTGYPVCILGKSYKADVNLTVGSPALLLSSFLDQNGVDHGFFDPYCDPDVELPIDPRVFFVATNHTAFKSLELPRGSVLIDPWGDALKPQDEVNTIRPGRSPEL